MRQVTIDEIALEAARDVEEIILKGQIGGSPQRQAQIQVEIARWIEHAVTREARNDRRRVRGRGRRS